MEKHDRIYLSGTGNTNHCIKKLEHYKNYLYIKIMPSDKNTILFYEKYGLKQYKNYCSMEIKQLDYLQDELT